MAPNLEFGGLLRLINRLDYPNLACYGDLAPGKSDDFAVSALPLPIRDSTRGQFAPIRN